MKKSIFTPLASLLLVATLSLADQSEDPIIALLGGVPASSESDTPTTPAVEPTVTPTVTPTATPVVEPVTKEEVTGLYVANFNRAPDSEGLNYWVHSEVSIEMIAMSFYAQQETKELYPEGYSNADFINEVYENLFGREPDSEGFEYWVDELDSRTVSKAVFILAVLNGSSGDDKKLMEKKRDVGLEFAESGQNDIDKAREVVQAVTITTTTIHSSYNSEIDIDIDGNNNSVNIN